MAVITFTKQQKLKLVNEIQHYFAKELEQEIGDFDAEFLLDFFSDKVGGVYYNQGLNDAKQLLDAKLETITESFYELEKITDFD